MLATRSRRSSGRAVLTLIVAPTPPVGVSAREVLYTSMAEIESDDRLAKSNAREPLPPWFNSLMADVGI